MKQFQKRKPGLLLRTEGAAAVEFAIIVPILLLFACGIFDLGDLYYQKHTASEAARVGARLAAVGGTSDAVTTAAQNYGSKLSVDIKPTTPTSGQNVTVTVSSSVNIITPIMRSFFANNPTTVTGKCIMQVE
jgi:Flp pilus assembly protein TadG